MNNGGTNDLSVFMLLKHDPIVQEKRHMLAGVRNPYQIRSEGLLVKMKE